MVERVPGLEAELEVHLLAYRELFPNRQIGREVRRAAYAAQRSRGVAQSVIGRTLEDGVIHKVIVHPIRAVVALGRPHDIGPQRTTSAAIGGQQQAVPNSEGQRTSISDAPDAARLPSTD